MQDFLIVLFFLMLAGVCWLIIQQAVNKLDAEAVFLDWQATIREKMMNATNVDDLLSIRAELKKGALRFDVEHHHIILRLYSQIDSKIDELVK